MNVMNHNTKQPLVPHRAQPCIEVVDWDIAELLQHLPGEERMRRGGALGDGIRRVVAQQIRLAHPEWTQEQLLQEMLRRASHG